MVWASNELHIYQTEPLASETMNWWRNMEGVLLLIDKIAC